MIQSNFTRVAMRAAWAINMPATRLQDGGEAWLKKIGLYISHLQNTTVTIHNSK